MIVKPEYTIDERKALLTDTLRHEICEVTFTKVNGEQRVMPCTLREDIVPKFESKGIKKKNDAVLSVWCTDKNEWRSFRIDSVTGVKIL